MGRILIVDDDRDLLELYSELLEQMGHHVICALDGVAALRFAAELKPDLILTDWLMPRMDGIELCKALRRNRLLDGIHIILHSSEAVPEPWHADACLRKQNSLDVIETLVEAMLSGTGETTDSGVWRAVAQEACAPTQ